MQPYTFPGGLLFKNKVPASVYSYLATDDGQRLVFYFKATPCPTRPNMKIKERSKSREIKGPSIAHKQKNQVAVKIA